MANAGGASSRSPQRADRLFGQIAISRHFVAPHHVRECLSELDRRSQRENDLGLADILVKRAYITQSQRDTIEIFVKKELGPDRLGRYVLLKKIGEGGMGTVYKAKDSSSGRVVAIKVLPPNLAQDKVFMGRFQREALAVTQLDHPHIVRGLDVGSSDDSHYIAMEFIEGIDCDKMLARRGRIPEQEAAKIGVQVASALGYAHERKLVHRDIKPANIVVTPDGIAKLTDLGLAKSTSATAAKLTQAGITMGTPHYISPEQAMGASDLDIRSDQYSLGATLYQLVTGRVPFEGSSPAIIVAKHLTEELENPQDIVPELSDGMTLVLEKMLAKDRDDRYAEPEDLVADLQKVADGKRPNLIGLEAGKSTLMKSADIREAAARLASKRRNRLVSRHGPATLVVGVLLGLGIAVGVVALLARSKPGVVDRFLSGSAEWTPLITDGLAGWRPLPPGVWRAGDGFIESVGPGEGLIETVGVFKGYALRAEVSASADAEAYLVVGKPRSAAKGGCRLRLHGRGTDAWQILDATVQGSRVSAFVGGERLIPEPGAAAMIGPAGGGVAFEARKGTFRFRNVRVRKLVEEPAPKK